MAWLRVLVAAAAALLVACAGHARVLALFHCELSGQTLSECCCGEHAEPSDSAALLAGSCCSKRLVEAGLPASAAGPSKLAEVGPGPALALAPSCPSAPPRLVARPLSTPGAALRDPQRTRAGPPLIIAHRRLLI